VVLENEFKLLKLREISVAYTYAFLDQPSTPTEAKRI